MFHWAFVCAGKRRYNIKLWKTFTDCFNCLPVSAIVDEKIFCCHGGLSPDLQSMEQIRRIMRPTDVPDQGLLCDLLWSDPDKVRHNMSRVCRLEFPICRAWSKSGECVDLSPDLGLLRTLLGHDKTSQLWRWPKYCIGLPEEREKFYCFIPEANGSLEIVGDGNRSVVIVSQTKVRRWANTENR